MEPFACPRVQQYASLAHVAVRLVISGAGSPIFKTAPSIAPVLGAVTRVGAGDIEDLDLVRCEGDGVAGVQRENQLSFFRDRLRSSSAEGSAQNLLTISGADFIACGGDFIFIHVPQFEAIGYRDLVAIECVCKVGSIDRVVGFEVVRRSPRIPYDLDFIDTDCAVSSKETGSYYIPHEIHRRGTGIRITEVQCGEGGWLGGVVVRVKVIDQRGGNSAELLFA